MRLHRIVVSSLGVLLAKEASAFTCAPGGIRVARIGLAPFPRRCSSSQRLPMAAESEATFPTIEQAAKDPFMSQLSHASEICGLLEKDDAKTITLASDLIAAMLSHSDGIRGFFATYLTGEGDTAADKEEIPEPLAGAMNKADMDVLVPLACMNVVMPTAMTSMHTDPELSVNAARTAQRGIRVLKYLQDKHGSVKTNCDAIRAVAAVASGDDADSCVEERVEYWTKFFKNYGYGEKEKEGIAKAMDALS
eukprot:CAMPEP_0197716104 /NCGR_PEP_ID=MMETSP1434-20131217/1117_1 /TAXON_ID=265543 /ORGANISM="Minutocellus polymorphus, Strain CCMP3303" /LENGTH=249 /DNA_ID=CAMNT_0043300411 /DNA_START=22 /DNA_END=771 /DNA_ORIENTATION=+